MPTFTPARTPVMQSPATCSPTVGTILFQTRMNLKDRNYYGITTSAGVGTPSGEFHANWGETYPITTRKFNIYEALYNRIERIREWCVQ